jgi:UPF0755 protein
MWSFMRVAALASIAGAMALVAVVVWVVSGTPGTILDEELVAPVRRAPEGTGVVTITVEEGDSAQEIGERLEGEGVIQSTRLFRVLAAFTSVEDQLVAGEYEFDRGMATMQVITRLHGGLTAPLVVTIPEGLRKEEIAELLERKGIVPAQEFRDALSARAYDAAFLDRLPAGVGLEGYLFPATYGFSRQVTGQDAVGKMLQAFDEQVVPTLPPEGATGLTLHQAVTVASIVEREAVVPAERPIIASVYLNRLQIGLPLQADPTVQYALGNDPSSVEESGYWKTSLTRADLAVDSPYNTYVNVGLPWGPIANPGLDSIQAVMRPARTNYLFFVAQEDGSHAFAETLAEHISNVCALDPTRPECVDVPEDEGAGEESP